MIRVLRTPNELGRAILALAKRGYGYHPDPIKNWDLNQIAEILDHYQKTSVILDLGASGGGILPYLFRAGYLNIRGIDLCVTWKDRMIQGLDLLQYRRWPYSLKKGDLMETHLPAHTIDFITCQSVIEHGVSIRRFLKECARLLKTGGTLFVSTDYWEDKIELDPKFRTFNLAWTIFSRLEIEAFIQEAAQHSLHLVVPGDIPDTEEKMCVWQGQEYTFLSLVFRKTA